MSETSVPNPRLREKYKKDVVPSLMKKFGYTSAMQAPDGTNVHQAPVRRPALFAAQ